MFLGRLVSDWINYNINTNSEICVQIAGEPNFYTLSTIVFYCVHSHHFLYNYWGSCWHKRLGSDQQPPTDFCFSEQAGTKSENNWTIRDLTALLGTTNVTWILNLARKTKTHLQLWATALHWLGKEKFRAFHRVLSLDNDLFNVQLNCLRERSWGASKVWDFSDIIA